MASNMMGEIRSALADPSFRARHCLVGDPGTDPHNDIEYSFWLRVHGVSGEMDAVEVRGVVNERGFARSIVEAGSAAPAGPGGDAPPLEATIERLAGDLTGLLFEALPLASRNALAVLGERIRSYESFPAHAFDQSIDTPAKRYLQSRSLTVVMFEPHELEHLTAFGLHLRSLGIQAGGAEIERAAAEHGAFAKANRDATAVAVWSSSYDPQEHDLHGVGPWYHFAALSVLTRHQDDLLAVLKEVRDHIIPLRRRLAIALQRDTDSRVRQLAGLKRYLTYVAVKLPVVALVVEYQHDTREQPAFTDKLATFANPSSYSSWRSIAATAALRVRLLDPVELRRDNSIDTERPKLLVSEAQREVRVFSEELAGVLQGSLLAQSVDVGARVLNVDSAALEMDRGGKNRANALKIVSVIVGGSLGLSIAQAWGVTGPTEVAWSVLAMAALLGLTEFWIRTHTRQYRLVIPVHARARPAALLEWTARQREVRVDQHGSRVQRTWNQSVAIRRDHGEVVEHRSASRLPHVRCRFGGRCHRFVVTLDHEASGYIHSIAVECEHWRTTIANLPVVLDLFAAMYRADLFPRVDGEYIPDRGGDADFVVRRTAERSVLAEVLLRMGEPIEPRYPSLTRLLATSRQDLAAWEQRHAQPGAEPMLEEDLEFVRDLFDRRPAYIAELDRLLATRSGEPRNESDREVTLVDVIGHDIIADRLDFLSRREISAGTEA